MLSKFPTKRILYVQYTNPADLPPLEHSSQILTKHNYEVLFLGTDSFGGELRFAPNPKIRVKCLPFRSAGLLQKLQYIRFCIWVLIWVVRWRPEWIYASDLLSCPMALFLSYLPGLKVVYHEHDSLTSQPESLFGQLCFAARRQLAKRAQICILPNQRRVEKFKEQTSISDKVFCVWNCPSLKEASLLAINETERKDNDFWVYYHGSIGPSRLPKALLHALAHLPQHVKLRVIGYETVGSQGYIEELIKLATHLGLKQRVEFIQSMPRYELLKHCKECNIGMSFMPKFSTDINMQCMIGASNKPFDYLVCALPLLVTDLCEWQEMYVEPGYALACDPEDPEGIANALRWFLDHPAETREMGVRGQQRILAEWNYEHQFQPVLERMLNSDR